MAKILLVEDDLLVGEAVIDVLDLSNHTVDWIKDGREGLERLVHFEYELAILDWNLPGLSGIEICQEYRKNGGSLPVMMLTGNDLVFQKVEGLDSGADDYLTKPFLPQELTARVRALLRRPPEVVPKILKVSDLSYDTSRGRVSRAEVEITLLPRELALLEFLMRHPDQVFSVDEILSRVWSSESESTELAVRQCVARLRKKIDREGEDSLIVNVKGLGYKIIP